jgi:hypothetical protein
MTELLLFIIAVCLGVFIGTVDKEDTYQRACIAKYSDMPHNQVSEHCNKILKFEKE